MTKVPIPLVLLALIAVGTVRLTLGSSTAPIAYVFASLFWIISLILLVEAGRQMLTAKKPEEKIESICICTGLVSLFLQGVLGQGHASPIAALVFVASAFVLLLIYGRWLRRGMELALLRWKG